jgi:hypothetical protein
LQFLNAAVAVAETCRSCQILAQAVDVLVKNNHSNVLRFGFKKVGLQQQQRQPL